MRESSLVDARMLTSKRIWKLCKRNRLWFLLMSLLWGFCLVGIAFMINMALQITSLTDNMGEDAVIGVVWEHGYDVSPGIRTVLLESDLGVQSIEVKTGDHVLTEWMNWSGLESFRDDMPAGLLQDMWLVRLRPDAWGEQKQARLIATLQKIPGVEQLILDRAHLKHLHETLELTQIGWLAFVSLWAAIFGVLVWFAIREQLRKESEVWSLYAMHGASASWLRRPILGMMFYLGTIAFTLCISVVLMLERLLPQILAEHPLGFMLPNDWDGLVYLVSLGLAILIPFIASYVACWLRIRQLYATV